MTVELIDEVDPKKRVTTLVGERVHALMWSGRRTQKQLAAILGIDQSAVSARLRGKTEWSVVDLIVTAEWLGVPPADLLPNVEVSPGDDDPGAVGAPTRARTWDLRIKSP